MVSPVYILNRKANKAFLYNKYTVCKVFTIMKHNINITMDQKSTPDPLLKSNLQKIELERIEEPAYEDCHNVTSITVMLQTGDKIGPSAPSDKAIEKKRKSGMIMQKATLKLNIFFVKIEIEWGRSLAN